LFFSAFCDAVLEWQSRSLLLDACRSRTSTMSTSAHAISREGHARQHSNAGCKPRTNVTEGGTTQQSQRPRTPIRGRCFPKLLFLLSRGGGSPISGCHLGTLPFRFNKRFQSLRVRYALLCSLALFFHLDFQRRNTLTSSVPCAEIPESTVFDGPPIVAVFSPFD